MVDVSASDFGASMSVSVGAFDRFPAEPGLYAMYSDVPLPGVGWLPSDGPSYFGRASDGLRRRLEKEHGGDTGRSTLRRSLAGLLKDDLGLAARARKTRSEPKPIDFTNFSLDPDSNERLTEWMAAHLTVTAVPVGEDLEAVEKRLIGYFEPPLCLQGWANPWAEDIRLARKRCADEARQRRRNGL